MRTRQTREEVEGEGEEGGGGQAAHGYMEGGRWREEVGAFINLESTGADGPDFLFQQSGTSSPSPPPPRPRLFCPLFHFFPLIKEIFPNFVIFGPFKTEVFTPLL